MLLHHNIIKNINNDASNKLYLTTTVSYLCIISVKSGQGREILFSSFKCQQRTIHNFLFVTEDKKHTYKDHSDMLRRNACNRCYLCLRHDAREMRQIDYNNNNLQEVPAKVQDAILLCLFLMVQSNAKIFQRMMMLFSE